MLVNHSSIRLVVHLQHKESISSQGPQRESIDQNTDIKN